METDAPTTGLVVPKPHGLGREMDRHAGPWDLQFERGVPLPPQRGKRAKSPVAPTCRLREGDLLPRKVSDEGAQVTDFDRDAAFLARTPEN